ncbi:hypothetical protein [Kocuria rosea]|uniref:hypothetical protein n=1 Tax=Kocuria rosea TaxID=1275 RepID=UPI0023301E72|nr:hypothetical protein [Kocuria rosea]
MSATLTATVALLKVRCVAVSAPVVCLPWTGLVDVAEDGCYTVAAEAIMRPQAGGRNPVMADTDETKLEAAQADRDPAEQIVDQPKTQATGTSEGALDDQTGNDPE